MVEIVISVAAKVSEYLVHPVVRQLGYLFHHRDNIDNLSQQVGRLRDARARQQHSVDEAIRRKGHYIEPDVCKWLTDANEFIQEASKFLQDEKAAGKSCLYGLCPNLKSRYQLSRTAKKKAEDAAQLLKDGVFERISYYAPPPPIRSALPPGAGAGAEALQSRISALSATMEALMDANINKIGVWGLGGVGKTTLVKQVAQQAAQEKLFDVVVMASVSQTPDYKEIQQEVADKLGVKFEELSEQGRAARLHQRMKEEKNILVILDDLWAEVELEKIGIPSPDDHKGCKLLLTSRNKDVLSNKMGTQKDFQIQHLQEEESWILFKNIAGDSIKEPDLQPIAIEVARHCAGLPIAIVTVGAALKSKSLSVWNDALQQLKTQTSTNITGMETKVYSSLKLSYDFLESDEVKSFFLLCALFSNNIHVRDLLKYGTGLRLFKGTKTLEEARNRIDTLVDKLKASNLLLDTGNNAFVRIHDLVQNVAIDIASKQHHEFRFQEATIGVEEWPKMEDLQKFTIRDVDVDELPGGLVCPKLQLFGCYCRNPNSVVKIPNTFFEEMQQLIVVDLSRMYLPSLPSSLQCLSNLRTLCLDGCKLGDIAIITELKRLEILSLMHSDIEELPREIAQLTRLRLFDLEGSSKLKIIPPDLISSLSRLESLHMAKTFTQWEMMEGLNKSSSNASLVELKHLSHLTSLDIQIPDVKLFSKHIHLFAKLVRYKILVGDISSWSWEENFKTNRTLKLDNFDTSLHLVDDMRKLLNRSEDVHLRQLSINGVSKLDGEGFPRLKHLKVGSSPEIEYIVNSMDLIPSLVHGDGAFPVMETLSLYHLIHLKQVCLHERQLPAGSFGRLKNVEMEDCNGLKFLFSLSVVRGLSRLETIIVSRCEGLVEIVSQEGLSNTEIKEDPPFPELRVLELRDLPKLKHICNWGFSSSTAASAPPVPTIIIFPKLKVIWLESLPTLTSFSTGYHSLQSSTPYPVLFPERVAFPCLELLHVNGLDNVKKLWDNQLPQDSFSKLKAVWVKSCGEMLNIFPCCILKRLRNLLFLIAEDCVSLKEVFDVEGMGETVKEDICVIPLSQLLLNSLPKVEKIWSKDPHGILSFQHLKSIITHKCGSLKNLFPAFLARDLVELQELIIMSCGIEEIVAKDHKRVDDEAWFTPGLRARPTFTFVFPKVTTLRLDRLPEMRSLYPEPHTSHWPLLEKLTVCYCDKVNDVFGFQDGNLDISLFSHQQIAFPHLEELKLFGNKGKEIWIEAQLSMNCFPRLKVLLIDGYRDILIAIPPFMLQRLHSLERLDLTECSSVKEVFQLDEDCLDKENQAMWLVCLRNLKLFKLPALTHLWKQNSKPGPTLESLQTLQAWNCGSLINLLPSSVSFQNLVYLTVLRCGKLTSLMSPSVAKTLVALETLIIAKSHMMEEVVSNEGSAGEALQLTDHEIAFPQLQLMELQDLPNLTGFNSGGNIFSFPSLEHMMLTNCPNMKIFSPSPVSTPKLERIRVAADSDQWHWQDDLNTTILNFVYKPRECTDHTSNQAYLSIDGVLNSMLYVCDACINMVAFPCLEILVISGLDNVKKLWDNQLPQDSFSKLKAVLVKSCGALLNIFPSCMLILIAEDCISLKHKINKDWCECESLKNLFPVFLV